MSQQHTFTPAATAPWTAVVDLWRAEMDRMVAEQTKAMERSFVEAERMLGEGYRAAQAQLVANQETARRFTTAFQNSVETLSKQA